MNSIRIKNIPTQKKFLSRSLQNDCFYYIVKNLSKIKLENPIDDLVFMFESTKDMNIDFFYYFARKLLENKINNSEIIIDRILSQDLYKNYIDINSNADKYDIVSDMFTIWKIFHQNNSIDMLDKHLLSKKFCSGYSILLGSPDDKKIYHDGGRINHLIMKIFEKCKIDIDLFRKIIIFNKNNGLDLNVYDDINLSLYTYKELDDIYIELFINGLVHAKNSKCTNLLLNHQQIEKFEHGIFTFDTLTALTKSVNSSVLKFVIKKSLLLESNKCFSIIADLMKNLIALDRNMDIFINIISTIPQEIFASENFFNTILHACGIVDHELYITFVDTFIKPYISVYKLIKQNKIYIMSSIMTANIFVKYLLGIIDENEKNDNFIKTISDNKIKNMKVVDLNMMYECGHTELNYKLIAELTSTLINTQRTNVLTYLIECRFFRHVTLHPEKISDILNIIDVKNITDIYKLQNLTIDCDIEQMKKLILASKNIVITNYLLDKFIANTNSESETDFILLFACKLQRIDIMKKYLDNKNINRDLFLTDLFYLTNTEFKITHLDYFINVFSKETINKVAKETFNNEIILFTN